MGSRPSVLVVDDEIRSQEAIRRLLDEEFHVLTASDTARAERLLESEMVDAILCDQRMPGETGVVFLERVRERWPDPVRIIISGYSDSEDIITGVNRAGIYQYVTKPWVPEQLLNTVRSAVALARLHRDNQTANIELKMAVPVVDRAVRHKRLALKQHFGFDKLIYAADSPLGAICEQVRKIARYDISILITGESGTGKELLARAIHYCSGRNERAFVVENCGALPDQLLESELFGCKKGAFTGAYEDRIGLFEQADGGTIFLDEIGETSLAFQVKLLRVLQEREIRPLGSTIRRKVDVRVIAATNRDLEAEVMAGQFRRDLYYRLAAFPVHMPALLERPNDIPPLAEHLLHQTSRAFDKPIRGFTAETLHCLCAYPWPGNVRELQNEIQRMVALCETDMLEVALLSQRVRSAAAPGHTDPAAPRAIPPASAPAPGRTLAAGQTLKERVEHLEENVLREAVARHRGNISHAAQELGLSRVGLRGKLQRYGLDRAD